MSLDHRTVDHRWPADLRASLSDDFAARTARLRELTELNADTGDPGEAHIQAELLVATRRIIEQITGALQRIAEGTYGVCQRCDRNIPVERLEVLPHARCCRRPNRLELTPPWLTRQQTVRGYGQLVGS
ncbi:TraR/DksA family transcriptional regulator [Actinoplanes sp. NPDC004185]